MVLYPDCIAMVVSRSSVMKLVTIAQILLTHSLNTRSIHNFRERLLSFYVAYTMKLDRGPNVSIRGSLSVEYDLSRVS